MRMVKLRDDVYVNPDNVSAVYSGDDGVVTVMVSGHEVDMPAGSTVAGTAALLDTEVTNDPEEQSVSVMDNMEWTDDLQKMLLHKKHCLHKIRHWQSVNAHIPMPEFLTCQLDDVNRDIAEHLRKKGTTGE